MISTTHSAMTYVRLERYKLDAQKKQLLMSNMIKSMYITIFTRTTNNTANNHLSYTH